MMMLVSLMASLVLSDMEANCYRRMNITLSQCVSTNQFDMYLYDRSANAWTKKAGLNCFGGNGARTVPGPEPWPANDTPVTLSKCQTACSSDQQCTGIVTGVFRPAPPPPPPGGIKWNPGEQIPGPDGTKPVSEWLAAMKGWQTAARGDWFTGAAYKDPQLKWTQTAYIQPQMHPYDRFFFDPTIGSDGDYTVQKWLDDVDVRYGGVDAILMWPTYTNIGIDDRSQYDLFEAMPGGIAGVRKAVDQLHAAGVKVLIPYNPWDAGTLRCGPKNAQGVGGATCGGNANLTAETAKNLGYCDGPATAANPGVCDARIMDSLIAEMDADGFNGDTMGFVPEEFYDVSVGLNHSVAIEPEGGGNVVNLDSKTGNRAANWDTMGWGYWGYPYVPSVDTWKWQDSRRMTNICERWSKNHTNALQYALFNGDGFESWENVWGTWNGITETDGEQIRRVGSLLRFLGNRGYLQSQGWIPHVATADSNNLFASFWPTESGDKTAAWTIVNRALDQRSGPAIKDVAANLPAGTKFYDLYNGVEVTPGSDGTLPLSIERFGAVLATTKGPNADPELKALMAKMAGYAKVPLASLDPSWSYERGGRVPVARAESPTSTEGMKKIPGGPILFETKGIEIEGGGGSWTGNNSDQNVNPYGVDFQYEWEHQPGRYHLQNLHVPAYWLDITPVTQGAYAKYLAANKSAMPDDLYHYLKNWDWSNPSQPKPFAENDTLPVTYVGMDEARAYCKAVGKRLPHEEEWMFAASGGGNSTQTYPWGNEDPTKEQGKYMPEQRTGTVFPGPEHVGKYPAGASPFGIMDLIGNIWQYTDEYQDSHTRSVIVKGGTNYRPSSSMWYFPMIDGNCGNGHCGSFQNKLHNKYFLMNSRYERAGTLGFRCAADVAGSDTGGCGGGKAVCTPGNACSCVLA